MTRDQKKYNNHPTGAVFTGQPLGGFFMGTRTRIQTVPVAGEALPVPKFLTQETVK